MSVYEIINKMRVYENTENTYYTHLTMGARPGKYTMDRTLSDTFFNAYCNSYNKQQLCILEKPQSFVPVLVDVDIKLPVDSVLRYTEDQLKSIIHNYQVVLKEIVDNLNDDHLICFVLEKAAYQRDQNTKNGFHLHFPYVFLSKSDQENYLIPRVKTLVKKSAIFSTLGFEDSSKLIDACHIKNAWLMYGSSKSEELKPYLLTKIYNKSLEVISIEKALENFHIYNSSEDEINIRGSEEFYLPRILSTSPYSRQICELKQNLSSVLKIDISGKTYEYDTENDEGKQRYTDVQLTQMEEKLKLVNKARFSDMKEWFKLLCLMKGRGMNIKFFIQISQESGYHNFSEESCNEHWYNTKPRENGCGMNCINKWLEEDKIDWKTIFCPKKEKLIGSLLNTIYKIGLLTDLAVAEIFYDNYKDNLIYTQMGWIHFNENYGWRNQSDSELIYPLMKNIGEKFLNYVCSQKKKEDEDEKEFAKKILFLKKEAIKLCTTTHCQKIIKTIQALFFDDNALSTFDEKPHWFCFSNMKAINIRDKQIIDIKATDRILTTCGYPLPEREEIDVTTVTDLLETIMPPDNMKSFLSSLAIFIYGNNINEKFIVFRGEGRNGKGLTISLLEKVMGKYFYALPTEVLTSHSKGAGRASPELMGAQFARCVIASEPDQSSLIVKTTINLLTGNDTISARQLQKQQITFKPKFTLGLMCNDLPNISGGINDAIKSRLEIQTFPYCFKEKDEMDANNTKHKEIDTTLKEKIKTNISYRNGLLFILIDAWIENEGKYISCDDSKIEQNEYAKANNPLSMFLEQYEHSSYFLKISALQKEYDKSYDHISASKFKNFLEQAKIKIIEDRSNGHSVYLTLRVK